MDNGFEKAQHEYENKLPSEGKIICRCEECGEEIYEGDDVYDIGGNIIHEDCLIDWMKLFKAIAGDVL